MKASLGLSFVGIYAVVLALADHGDDYAEAMGPVAFLWPSDREWGAAKDNTAPCGSAAGVSNRTQYPLWNGQVALVAQDESWSIQVAISHRNSKTKPGACGEKVLTMPDPTSNEDFETVIAAMRIPELDEGHQCYPIPDPPVDVEAGANATLQIKYTSDFDTDKNETFYACADITYVSTSQFTYQVPCFNATVDDYNITEPGSTSSGTAAGASATATTPSQSSGPSSSHLSGGAIAGIVVGVVAGVTAFLAALFFCWRRTAHKKRLRQQSSIRAVKWDENTTGSPSASHASNQDVALSDLHTTRD
ncbi:hypothetical protein H2202_010215 [Exophiala xenobiotica]|nr:hypothetical protein H2202_010215 [Exophiala xenobiotica]KAK5329886.1 hypothetical protein LTR93_001474 [Exophiala xenobiotica]